MTETKRKNHMLWLALAAVLLGIGIQILLALLPGRKASPPTETPPPATASAPVETEAVPTEPPETEPPEPTAETEAERDDGSILILVNKWNPLPEGYEPELEDINVNGDHRMDARCADALLRMLKDCHDAGNKPYLCSTYRTREDQERLYENKIQNLIDFGADPEAAPEIAAMSVAIPGTSEHQLGLAADIIDEEYTALDEGQEDTSTQQWLMENAWRYGFILRYPNGTTDITGIIYEPWHYRYVGLSVAREIYELGTTLEEYIELKTR